MNLTSELDAVTRYYKVVQIQKTAMATAEDELRRRIAEYEEERFCLLVERAVEAGKGWCTICHGIFSLDQLHAAVSQRNIHAVCFACGSTLPSLKKEGVVLWVRGNANSYPLEDCGAGIMHPLSRHLYNIKGIPPKLVAEFIHEIPEIQLATDDSLVIGIGGKYVRFVE